jgi:hypothetical protein
MLPQLSNKAVFRILGNKYQLAKVAALALLFMSSWSVLANTYKVQRMWTDDGSSSFGSPGFIVCLKGTVEIPRGTYILDKDSPSPFTSVNLVMTIKDGAQTYSFDLVEAYAFISGNARVIIQATDKSLVFDHSADAGPADEAILQFWDTNDLICYGLGHDIIDNSQAAIFDGIFVIERIPFPQTFGTILNPAHPSWGCQHNPSAPLGWREMQWLRAHMRTGLRIRH